MIVEIKYRTGTHGTVRAFVTKEKPTPEQIDEIGLAMMSSPENRSYSEIPVQSIIKYYDGGQVLFRVTYWNGQVATIFQPFITIEDEKRQRG